MVGWLTAGDPNSWSVIAIDSECTQYDRFDLNATEFLTRWLKNEISVSFYPEDVQPVGAPSFTRDSV